jgi:hypothetical protein
MLFLCFIIERDAPAEMFFGRRRDGDSTNKQVLFLVHKHSCMSCVKYFF